MIHHLIYEKKEEKHGNENIKLNTYYIFVYLT